MGTNKWVNYKVASMHIQSGILPPYTFKSYRVNSSDYNLNQFRHIDLKCTRQSIISIKKKHWEVVKLVLPNTYRDFSIFSDVM